MTSEQRELYGKAFNTFAMTLNHMQGGGHPGAPDTKHHGNEVMNEWHVFIVAAVKAHQQPTA